jgi:hypothetical protein
MEQKESYNRTAKSGAALLDKEDEREALTWQGTTDHSTEVRSQWHFQERRSNLVWLEHVRKTGGLQSDYIAPQLSPKEFRLNFMGKKAKTT